MGHILVVDDDPSVMRSIQRVLEAAGFAVQTAGGGREALEAVARQRPDLIVLDIIMPDLDGLEVCRRIRADPFLAKLPILFLTAKGRSTDIAAGLDAGADDFLTKPFDIVELPARVRALLRRAPGGPLDTDSEFVRVGDLCLHAKTFEVEVGERRVELTRIEHQLLHYLVLHAGQPVSVEQLLHDVWEYPSGAGDPILVRVHIGNLRAKIEPTPEAPRYIRNIRGRGYMLQR